MAKRLAPLPTSRAKTAYGLLSAVCRLILEEPKRYDQAIWIKRLRGYNDAIWLDESEAPACGTVGCVAGWVATLKRGNNFHYGETWLNALTILGISIDQSPELFRAAVIDGRLTPGTLEYAEAGVAHIRRFQKKYAAQLKATKV